MCLRVAAIPSGAAAYPFSLNYDPNGAGGPGTVSATFGSYSNVMTLDSGHKADGALFNRFGIINVMKSADDAGQIWLDNVTINGEPHPFDSDPGWDERNNRNTYISSNVRPRFDFGYSPGSNFAGGQSAGEIGGQTFRGHSRLQFNGSRMAYYADPQTNALRPWNSYRAIMWVGDTAYKKPEKLPLFYERLREMGINTAM